jgi:hypothetical protein
MPYADTKELKAAWYEWSKTQDPVAWDRLADGVYKICCGVATKFHPQTEEEKLELAHHAFALTLGKIRNGVLWDNGRTPVFNLFTTAIFNCLFSLKMTEKRRRSKLVRYTQQALENLPQHMRSDPLQHASGGESTIKTGKSKLVKY